MGLKRKLKEELAITKLSYHRIDDKLNEAYLKIKEFNEENEKLHTLMNELVDRLLSLEKQVEINTKVISDDTERISDLEKVSKEGEDFRSSFGEWMKEPDFKD